jgi:putative transposase
VKPISFKRHRFRADVIRQAAWLYFRSSLSFRDVEELMAARGMDVSYETIRCWTIKFGLLIARRLKKRRNTAAALTLLRRLLHNQPVEPQTITTDGLASYGAALDQLDLRHLH